jgi:hypothetical protein
MMAFLALWIIGLILVGIPLLSRRPKATRDWLARQDTRPL